MTQPLPSVMCMVTVYVSVPDELSAPLPAELHYDMADPYAVRLSLGAPAARPVDWVFARSLLAEGLHRPAGTGDVLVIPQRHCRPASVCIVLRSAAGAALVDIPASTVAAFLRRTDELVPPGTESPHIDMDRALAELTGRQD
ncbi:SsgA family sporulation/cell division regulator [Streptomyces cocklensis]|uniref:Sporulation-specific cell division protein SsgB n=1 Tax=Actinacidiphila cocklensis TaxID=887465 RepID=A0A9W4GRX9_9ACTN|nr:SsgA family sporulation/cell division regulator [Actinacidiphila cocklensis]MDD1063513.1 SsgA family sporulation/cell division regulator [Actinacidiphila cocklensis]CAG6394758.1 Sporulation-specific cell division protein SsgB [Actinacidiphila cocklensis]